MLIDIDIILKPGIVAFVEVEFEVSSSGHRGDYNDPSQPDEYEITGLAINHVRCVREKTVTKLVCKTHNPEEADRAAMLTTAMNRYLSLVWIKTGRELIQYGWHDALCKIAKPLLENDYYDEWQRLADHEFNTEPYPC